MFKSILAGLTADVWWAFFLQQLRPCSSSFTHQRLKGDPAGSVNGTHDLTVTTLLARSAGAAPGLEIIHPSTGTTTQL